MAKAILMSIKPEWVAKILNGEKTIEIRKRFPKDYVGWVYIYCTKDNNNLLHKNCADIWWVENKDFQKKEKLLGNETQPYFNGKVVARFWCDKVEEVSFIDLELEKELDYHTETMSEDVLLKKSCLQREEIKRYLNHNGGYAIHISKLEIFDRPTMLEKFRRFCDKHFSYSNRCLDCKAYSVDFDLGDWCCKSKLELTKAPQSWCYVEV